MIEKHHNSSSIQTQFLVTWQATAICNSSEYNQHHGPMNIMRRQTEHIWRLKACWIELTGDVGRRHYYNHRPSSLASSSSTSWVPFALLSWFTASWALLSSSFVPVTKTSRFGIVGSGFFNPKPQTPTLNPKPKTYPTLHPFGVEGVEFTAGPCLRCFLCAGTSHQQKPGLIVFRFRV